jgi:hypothetical protein
MIHIRGPPKDAHGGAENETIPDLSLAMMYDGHGYGSEMSQDGCGCAAR